MNDGSQKVGLVRDLSLFDVTMVGVGAMIGAGIFVLTGIAAGTAGPALILAFAINGIVTIFTAMVYAELGSAIPEAGGGYLWVKEGLPAWNAFLAGWMSWFAHAVAGSLYALGFGAYFELMLRAFDVSLGSLSDELVQKVLAVIVVLTFTAVNFKGVSETGKVGNAITLGKIVILGIFIVSGLLAVWHNPSSMEKFTPFAPKGMTGVLTAMGLTFIAFEGYEIIVQAGEEVVEPKKNIPRAVFLSLAIVVPIYILVAFAALGAVTPETDVPTWQWLASHAELGLAEAARQFMPFGTTLLLAGGLLSTTSALNATTFSSTRVAFAMGRDRNLPDAFGEIHARTHTPYWALAASSVLMVFMALAMPIEDVAAAADVMFLLLFLQVNIAVLTIRKKYGDKLDYGYLTPFFPVMPFLAIASMLFLAVFMLHFSVTAWGFVVGWVGGGLGIYYFYARGREREKEVTPVVLHERPTPVRKEFRVLAAVANPQTADTILEVAARMVRPMDGQVLLLHVATVPRQVPLIGNRRLLERVRPAVDATAHKAEQHGVEFESLVRLGHNPWKGIVHTVQEEHAEFLIMGWRGRSRDPNTLIGRNIDHVLRRSPCHVVVVQHQTQIPAERILIPVAHPANARLLLALGRLLLDENAPERKITLLHVLRPGMPADERDKRLEQLQTALRRPAFFDPEDAEIPLDGHPITLDVVEAPSIVRAVEQRSREADLLMVGSSQQTWLRRRIFGEVGYQIVRHAHCPAIMVNQETHAIRFSIQHFFQFFRQLEETES